MCVYIHVHLSVCILKYAVESGTKLQQIRAKQIKGFKHMKKIQLPSMAHDSVMRSMTLSGEEWRTLRAARDVRASTCVRVYMHSHASISHFILVTQLTWSWSFPFL